MGNLGHHDYGELFAINRKNLECAFLVLLCVREADNTLRGQYAAERNCSNASCSLATVICIVHLRFDKFENWAMNEIEGVTGLLVSPDFVKHQTSPMSKSE